MLTRRHIRVKVMQCIYAMTKSPGDTLEKQQKFLAYSIQGTYVLYLLTVDLLAEVHGLAAKELELAKNRYLPDVSDTFPDKHRFVENRILVQLSGNEALRRELRERRLDNWRRDDEYVRLIFKAIKESPLYAEYMMSPGTDYDRDRDFLSRLFKEVIAPNDKLYDYFEDERLTWVDDIPIVNTFVLKRLGKARPGMSAGYFTPPLLKDDEDMDFARKLLDKTVLKNEQWEREIQGKTPNWDKDRIADLDLILLKMAICELLSFPSIPEKVTINEFLEIAKEYSTPKSSIFINGVLDKLVKDYRSEGKLNKIGRGLL